MNLLVILYAHLLAFCLTTSQECTGPVSFTNNDFTIRGPCPNYTVLAAVGSTIQYRCDYIDKTTDDDVPYWYIPELSRVPFIAGSLGGGMQHNITIKNVQPIDKKRSSNISMLVKKQYLNSTLNIQCGLCSVFVVSTDRLGENIISAPPMKLVSFYGTLRDLNSSINSDGVVSLNWSPPIVSVDYTNCTEQQQCFMYEVKLIDVNLQSPQFSQNTSSNWLSINIIDLNTTEPTGISRCQNYKWTVTVIALSSGSRSETVGPTIELLTVVNITSNVSYELLGNKPNAKTTIKAYFNVSSSQSLDTLNYLMVFNNSLKFFNMSNNISVNISSDQVSLTVTLPFNWPYTDCIERYFTVGVNHKCGTVFADNVTTCPQSSPLSSPVTISLLSSSFTSEPTLTSNIALTNSTTISASTSTSTTSINPYSSMYPSVSSTTGPSTQPLLVIVIPVSIGVLTIILCILLLCVLSLAVYTKKNTRNKVNLSKALNNTNNSNDIADGIYTTANEGYSQLPEHTTTENASYEPVQATAVSDYLTPCEAKQEYQKSTSIMSSSLEAQYCEPAQLISRSPSSGIHSSIGRAKGNSMKMEEMTEVPGYCVPPPDFRNSIKNRNNTLTRDNNRGKKSQGHPQGPSPENEPPPTYADISDMKAIKKIKLSSNSYAELNLSPTDDKPPPLPPPHQLQMTYSTIVNTHDNVD